MNSIRLSMSTLSITPNFKNKLDNSDSTGLTLETSSSSIISDASIAENYFDEESYRDKNGVVKEVSVKQDCNNKGSAKVLRFSKANTITNATAPVSTRISRRPSISIPRQRSLREIFIPERIAEEYDMNAVFTTSASHFEIFRDHSSNHDIDDYNDDDDDDDDDNYSNNSIAFSTTSYSLNHWKNAAVSNCASNIPNDNDTESEEDRSCSIRSIISKSSARILELPRDVEFDSSCDSSSEGDVDDLNADFHDMELYHQPTRYW
jgi:hypothetical protein